MGKRGRPKGTSGASFLGAHLRDLNDVLKPDAIVMVSRKYAEQLHLQGKPIKSENNGKHIEAVTEQIDVNVEEFNEDVFVEESHEEPVELSIEDF